MEGTYRRALGGAVIDDILSHGTEPRRRPWRRLIAAAIAAAVLAVLIIEHLPGGGPDRPDRSGAAAGSPVIIAPARPDGIAGPTAPWSAGLRLPVGGQRPAWLWPATGRLAPIGGLPVTRSGYAFTRVRGGWAVQAGAGASARCAGCAARPAPVYFLADRASSATLVGVADRVAPAARSGAVWLTSYPAGSDRGGGRGGVGGAWTAGYAREVTATGRRLGPRLRLPAGYLIDDATDRGLLLVEAVPRGAAPAYEVWDPATGRVSSRLSGVIAASPDRIAWTGRCLARCLVHVLDLATGRQTGLALPARSSAAAGAFSPDGKLLALELSIGNGEDGGAMATQLDVASVPGGQLAAVPGTWASSDALTGFGWPSDDDSLVAELSFLTKVQVASWHPGAGQLAVAIVAPGSNELIVG